MLCRTLGLRLRRRHWEKNEPSALVCPSELGTGFRGIAVTVAVVVVLPADRLADGFSGLSLLALVAPGVGGVTFPFPLPDAVVALGNAKLELLEFEFPFPFANGEFDVDTEPSGLGSSSEIGPGDMPKLVRLLLGCMLVLARAGCVPRSSAECAWERGEGATRRVYDELRDFVRRPLPPLEALGGVRGRVVRNAW